MQKMNTTDDTRVKYFKLYPNVSKIHEEITYTEVKKECYMLSLINPSRPHLTLIDCKSSVLKYFICEDMQEEKSTTAVITYDSIKSSSVQKCNSGEMVSTLFLCDGYEDCMDGSDEKNCSCFVDGNIISDSVFCAQNCTSFRNCSCSLLYFNSAVKGCSSFQGKLEVVKQTMVSLFSCKNSSQHIDSLLVNDLIIDCPLGDDEIEILNTSLHFESKCSHSSMLECYPGHTKCYYKEQRCQYLLHSNTQTLIPCRNGNHLQDCQDFQCQSMFKCMNSYCIPFRYVCDGQWDCWNGEDELSCKVITCRNMFKCRQTSTCIHINNVCDGIYDCLMEDDEKLCDVQNCAQQCFCLNYGIICEGISYPQFETFKRQLENFLFVKILEANMNIYMNDLSSTIIFIANKNEMIQPYKCRSDIRNTNMKILDLSSNNITILANHHFICLPNLTVIELKHNRILSIRNGIFNSLLEINILNFTHNNIKYIFKCSFCGLENLKILNIAENQIIFIDKTSLIGTKILVILTDTFHACCINEEQCTLCIPKAPLLVVCNALLYDDRFTLVTRILTILMLTVSILHIVKNTYILYDSKILKENDIFQICLNACYLGFCLYLCIISYKDILSGKNYTEKDLIWRSSHFCHLASILHIQTIFLAPIFYLQRTYTTYKIIKYPFRESQQKKLRGSDQTYFSILFPCINTIFTIGAIICIRRFFEMLNILSSPLCLLIGNTDKSQVQNIVTVFVAGYLLVYLSTEIGMCFQIVILIKNSPKLSEKHGIKLCPKM